MDRLHAIAEARLGAGEQGGLVVDVRVTRRREPALHLGEVILFVLVHEDIAAHREEQARPFDLHRLVHAVPVGKDRGLAVLPEV